MEIKPDLKNVLISFSVVAIVLFVGSDIYVRHQFALATADGQVAEDARKAQEQTIFETQQQLEAYMRTLEGEMNTEVVVLDEASSTEVVEVALEATIPETVPVKTVTPVVTQPAVNEEAELAKLQAQIDAAKKATEALATPTKTATVTPTKTTTTTVTPVKTTVVKPSRQSRAS